MESPQINETKSNNVESHSLEIFPIVVPSSIDSQNHPQFGFSVHKHALEEPPNSS